MHSSEEVLATLSPLLDQIVIKALAEFEEGRFQVRETIQQKLCVLVSAHKNRSDNLLCVVDAWFSGTKVLAVSGRDPERR